MNELVQDEPAEARQSYYAEAQSWADDRRERAEGSNRLVRRLLAGAAALLIAESLLLIALLPLKTVVPYTILVDRNTGFAQSLDLDSMPDVKAESALTQSLLAQYVVARETFDINGLQSQYRKVALWSADQARSDYLALIPAGNPESPLNRYPRGTIVQTVVESVTPTAGNSALVRFYTERRDRGQGASERSYWVSLIRFRFSGTPMSLEDRLINPLGFQVVHYRRDQEAPPPAPLETGNAVEPAVPPANNRVASPPAGSVVQSQAGQ
jgi:type IV secretion system protein VirB8